MYISTKEKQNREGNFTQVCCICNAIFTNMVYNKKRSGKESKLLQFVGDGGNDDGESGCFTAAGDP